MRVLDVVSDDGDHPAAGELQVVPGGDNSQLASR